MSSPRTPGLGKVIFTSSLGTLIEWYDFYIFASLAAILGRQFFPWSSGSAGLLSVLGIFATGMIVRPFGALVFGRMGDLIGRKHTFLLTLVLMGSCSTLIGLLPGYRAIGVLAPILMVVLRLIQGLALGGEYGGAATYVAETAPADRRGYFTSYIQITATAGLFVSLLLILYLRNALGDDAFAAWGWRVPFLLSGVLVVFSYAVRRRMAESPMFARLQAAGTTSKNPIAESFGDPVNRRNVLIALFGLAAGQGVIWHAGHFNSLYFLQSVLRLQMPTANAIMAWALALGAPFFVVFGALSDRIGRKRIVMAGMLLAVLCYIPIYSNMTRLTRFDADNHGPPIFAKALSRNGLGRTVSATQHVDVSDDEGVTEHIRYGLDPQRPSLRYGATSFAMDYTVSQSVFWKLVGLVWLQVIFATMVYGPMAALLVELFPTRVRYTSLSVPYHLGNGLFGGLVPLIGTWMVERTGLAVAGILYPVAIALMSFAVGSVFVRDQPVYDTAVAA